MKSDIDQFMAERELDGLWITGGSGDNPALDYLVGRAHLTHANILKKRGEPAVLYHGAMERDEAESTGLNTSLVSQSEVMASLEEAQGDEFVATAIRIKNAMLAQGFSGRIAVYGQQEIGRTLGILRTLEDLLPGCQLVNDSGPSGALQTARLTKDQSEINQIRQIGQITVEVVDQIADYLQTRQVSDEILLDEAGDPLTVEKVKNKIHLLLAERGAESPSGPIFAPGREGAIGHSVGRPEQQIRLGVPIVFDIFPRLQGGGYYFDFTRTWCLGYSPSAVSELHQQVLTVYQQIFELLITGASPQTIQRKTCQLFEEMGHPTVMSDPDTQSGYFHGLAHGLGLAIHEAPVFRHYDNPSDLPLQAGMVITHEPGLYYPERSMGVRLEDPLVIQAEGPPEVLVEYPHDLVLPMKND